MIEYKNISKKYDGQEILKDVSFAVKKGDIFEIHLKEKMIDPKFQKN